MTLKFISILIKRNPYKTTMIPLFIILCVIINGLGTTESIKVSKYIRLSPSAVYLVSTEGKDSQEHYQENRNTRFRNGYAIYNDYTTITVLFIITGILLFVLIMMITSDDNDVNFDFNYCMTLSRIGDVSIISVGDDKYVYMMDKKAIAITNCPHLEEYQLREAVFGYISNPNGYYRYTSMEEIRMDTISQIIG